MMETLQREFLAYSAEKLGEQCGRIVTCLGKLTDDQVWARGSENQNAIGNLVLHLCGNVRQWIISGVGGAVDDRRRDTEFAARSGVPVPELADRLRATVDEAAAVLSRVTTERLAQPLVIQGYPVSGLLAIYHVVEHFSGHTGQIIFATKMLTGTDLGFYQHLRAAAAHAEKTP
jgi:uncharacterized damage-inducible protein DinB